MVHSDASSSSEGKQGKKKKRKNIFIIVVLVLSVLVILIGWGVGIYRYQWYGMYSQKLVSYLPYPAVIVGDRWVSVSEFYEQMQIIDHFSKKASDPSQSSLQTLSEKDKRQLVKNKILKDQLAALLVKQNSLTVTEKDIDDKLVLIVGYDVTPDQASQAINELYGVDVKTFREKFVRPLVHLDTLKEFLDREGQNKEKKVQASVLLKEIREGGSFEELAQKWSEDDSAPNGGDLGFFPEGTRLPEIEDRIFSLEVGQVTDVLETPSGYHIVRVEDKKMVDVSEGEKQEQVKARYIFLKKKNVEDWLEEIKQQTFVYWFI